MYRLALVVTGEADAAATVVVDSCRALCGDDEQLPNWLVVLETTRTLALKRSRTPSEPVPQPDASAGEVSAIPVDARELSEALMLLDEDDRALLWSALVAPHHGPLPVGALARALHRLQAVLVNQSIPGGEELE
jgi:hypothetical protein